MKMVKLNTGVWINSSCIESVRVHAEHHPEQPSVYFVEVVTMDGAKKVFGPHDTQEEAEKIVLNLVTQINGGCSA